MSKGMTKGNKGKRSPARLSKALGVGALVTAAGDLLARKPAEPLTTGDTSAPLPVDRAVVDAVPAHAVADEAIASALAQPPAHLETAPVPADLAEVLQELADAAALADAAVPAQDESILLADAGTSAAGAQPVSAATGTVATESASAGASAATAAEGAGAAAAVSAPAMGVLGALGAVGVGIAAASGGGSRAPVQTPAQAKSAQGTAVDGYIRDAKVFYDADGDGVLDAGEVFTTTDAKGNFTLTGFTQTALGRIVVAAGGVDTETGNAVGALFLNANNLSDTGKLVVSPLTTLLALNPTLSEAQLKAALGIPASVDLLTYDPVAAMDAGGTGAAVGEAVFAAQQKAYALLQAATQAAASGGATPVEALAKAADALGKALADAKGEVDLGQAASQVFSKLVDPAQAEVLAKSVQFAVDAIDKAYIANPGEMSLSQARQLVNAGNTSAAGYAEAVARLTAAKAAASVSQTALLEVVNQVAKGEATDAGAVLQKLEAQAKQQEQKYNEEVVSKTNHEPTGGVTVSGDAVQGAKLTADTASLADKDGLGTLHYQWMADGKAIDGATGAQLELTQAVVGKAITVAVSYTDRLGAKEVVSSGATAKVANVDDAAIGTLAVKGQALQGGALTAQLSDVVDADGATTVAYQWQVKTANGWTNIAGATQASFAVANDQSLVGRDVRVVATTTDALGGKTVFEGAAQTIANVDDAATGTLSVAGTPLYGQSLTADLSNVVDADGATTKSYQWERLVDTGNGREWQKIDGATGASLANLGVNVTGLDVRVVVTTTDALGGQTTFTSTPQHVLATPTIAFGQGTVDSLVQGSDTNFDRVVERLQGAGMQTLGMNGSLATQLATAGFSIEAGQDVSITGGAVALANAGADAAMAGKLHTLLADADVSVRLNQTDMSAVLGGTDAQLDRLVDQLQVLGMDQLELDPGQVNALANSTAHFSLSAGTDVTVNGTGFLSAGASSAELGSLLGAADVAVRVTDANVNQVLAQGAGADDALDALVHKLHAAGMDSLTLGSSQLDRLASANLSFDAGTEITVTDGLQGFGVAASEQQYAHLLADADVTLRMSEAELRGVLSTGSDAAMDQVIHRLQQVGMDHLELDAGQVAQLATSQAHFSFEAGTDITVNGTGFLSAGATGAQLGALLGAADVTVKLTEQDLAQVLHDGDKSLDALVQQLQSAGMDALQLDIGQLDALAAGHFSFEAGTELTISGIGETADDRPDNGAEIAALVHAADVTVKLSEQDLGALLTGNAQAHFNELVADFQEVGVDHLALNAGQVAELAHAHVHLAAGADVTVMGTGFLSAHDVSTTDLQHLLGDAHVTALLSEQDVHGLLASGASADDALDSLTNRLHDAGVDALRLDAGQALELADAGGLSLNASLEVRLDDPLTLAQHASNAELDALHALLQGADSTAELQMADVRATQPATLEALRSEINSMQTALAHAGVDHVEFSDELADALAEAGVHFWNNLKDPQPSVGQDVVVKAQADTAGGDTAYLRASLQELQKLGVDEVVGAGGVEHIELAMRDAHGRAAQNASTNPGFDLRDLPSFEPLAHVDLIVTEDDLAALLAHDGFGALHNAHIDHLLVQGGNVNMAALNQQYGEGVSGYTLAQASLDSTQVQLLGLGDEPASPLDPFNHKHTSQT